MALTKEEKKARKEAKKLEKMRLEAEKKKQMRRDELTREIATQALRRSELDKSWREMMLKIKEPVFKQDIEVMWHTFERAHDKKEHLINHLMKLIDIADDQAQRTVACFCDAVDTTINKFLQDLEMMSKDNDRRTNALLKWAESISYRLTTEHNAAELHLQILLFHGHTTSDNYIWNTRGENMVKEDEERSNFLDIRDNLRSLLENSYHVMWDEYKSVLKSYVTGTADNQKQVRRLRRKENLMADVIASQAKKIASSDGVLKRLRAELLMYESGTKQAVFRERRDRHRAAALRLKRRMVNGVATDEKRLSTLVKSADDAIEWIETAQKKGVKIIRLAALCRKFETQREKVLPFGSEIPPDTSQAKTAVRHQQSDESLTSIAMMSTTFGLTRLWQRIAKAELGKRALIREKIILERENYILTEKLNGDIDIDMGGPDAIRCICGNEKKPAPVRPVAIDGALELAKYKFS